MQGSFAVRLWARLFLWLSKVLYVPFNQYVWIVRKCHGDTAFFVDVYVIGWLFLSAVSVMLCSLVDLGFLRSFPIPLLFVFLGVWRTIQITFYQLNVFLFDAFLNFLSGEKNYGVESYRRLVVHLGHNFLEILLWFGALYWLAKSHLNGGAAVTIARTLNYSFVTMTTFGSSGLAPVHWIGKMLQTFQSIVGFFIVLLTFANFVSMLPHPWTKDCVEQAQIRFNRNKEESL